MFESTIYAIHCIDLVLRPDSAPSTAAFVACAHGSSMTRWWPGCIGDAWTSWSIWWGSDEFTTAVCLEALARYR
ncbi:MAG TPA: hypothetical protein VM450_18825 [Thermomicrobiales bacterium]|nr:hypothetical protein [Thermomicrobiales bacterium]